MSKLLVGLFWVLSFSSPDLSEILCAWSSAILHFLKYGGKGGERRGGGGMGEVVVVKATDF